jgi:uncharacterized protein (TIGR03435 family)
MIERVALKLDRSTKFLLVAAGTIAIVVPSAFGQGKAPQPARTMTIQAAVQTPAFEVVSVKLNKSDQYGWFKLTPDGISAKAQTLMWFIQLAYGAKEQRMVSGAPYWINLEKYDIEAKVGDSDIAELAKLSSEQRYFMLQAVLEDRFRLKYHFETKDLPDFALIIGKNGTKGLSESKPVDPANPPHTWKVTGRYQMSAQGMSMAELALNILSTESQRLVVDKTGLTGRYDFTLQWSREDTASQQEIAPPPESSGPSIFTAIQEQLGLKLVPIMVPTKILVIDQVERPSEN